VKCLRRWKRVTEFIGVRWNVGRGRIKHIVGEGRHVIGMGLCWRGKSLEIETAGDVGKDLFSMNCISSEYADAVERYHA